LANCETLPQGRGNAVATYTIKIQNNSSKPGTYVVFQDPPSGAAALTGWSLRETVAVGSSAELSLTPPAPKPPGLFDKLRALLFGAPPRVAPDQFHLAVDTDGPQAGAHIDFQAHPTTSTTIVHGLDGGLSVAAVSTLGYSVFNTPVGNVAPSDQGDDFIAAYSIMAIFTNSAGPNCANGEYRQMVKGQFSVDGSIIMHSLCGSTVLSSTLWQEDGCPPGTCTAYGYRACPASASNMYSNPDQATGSQYAAYDQPGFHNIRPGYTYSIALQFQGQLVDTAVGATLATQSWSVEGQLAAPTVDLVDPLQGLQPSDRLVGVRLARNLANGGLEVHVLIARVHGSPQLDPNAVKVALVDVGGRPVTAAEPVAHEVGGQRGTTATLLHRLLPGQATPVKATLDIGGQVSEIAIAAD
jgi:uncharacterized repeat protein (TIGR01451 family)